MSPIAIAKQITSLGISCEKCHGPGKQHADLNAPGAAEACDQAIVNPAKLPRDRQLALCSLCHGGIGVAKAPAFSFTAGNALEDFLKLEISESLTTRSMFMVIRWRCWSEASVSNRQR